MSSSSSISDIEIAEVKRLISEIQDTNLDEESKVMLDQILNAFSKILEDAKASKLSIAKLKALLGFFSEKSKK